MPRNRQFHHDRGAPRGRRRVQPQRQQQASAEFLAALQAQRESAARRAEVATETAQQQPAMQRDAAAAQASDPRPPPPGPRRTAPSASIVTAVFQRAIRGGMGRATVTHPVAYPRCERALSMVPQLWHDKGWQVAPVSDIDLHPSGSALAVLSGSQTRFLISRKRGRSCLAGHVLDVAHADGHAHHAVRWCPDTAIALLATTCMGDVVPGYVRLMQFPAVQADAELHGEAWLQTPEQTRWRNAWRGPAQPAPPQWPPVPQHRTDGVPVLSMGKGTLWAAEWNPWAPHQLAMAGSRYVRARLWDVATHRFDLLAAPFSDALSLSFCWEGRCLLVGQRAGAVQLWDLRAPRKSSLAVNMRPHAVESAVTSVCSLRSDPWLVVACGMQQCVRAAVLLLRHNSAALRACNSRLELGDLRAARWRDRYQGYSNSHSISPCDSFVVTGGDDGVVRVWNTRSAKLVRTVATMQATEPAAMATADTLAPVKPPAVPAVALDTEPDLSGSRGRQFRMCWGLYWHNSRSVGHIGHRSEP